MTLREEYQASLKSLDTEEWFDLHFHRPLGFLWAKLFAKLGVSPNAITVASIFMGVAGGILLYNTFLVLASAALCAKAISGLLP